MTGDLNEQEKRPVMICPRKTVVSRQDSVVRVLNTEDGRRSTAHQAGLLTRGSFRLWRLPIDLSRSTVTRAKANPHLQRRDRAGFSPASLFIPRCLYAFCGIHPDDPELDGGRKTGWEKIVNELGKKCD